MIALFEVCMLFNEVSAAAFAPGSGNHQLV